MRVCIIVPITKDAVIPTAQELQPTNHIDLQMHSIKEFANVEEIILAQRQSPLSDIKIPLKHMSGTIERIVKDYTIAKLMERNNVKVPTGGDCSYLQLDGVSLLRHSSGAHISWAECITRRGDQKYLSFVMDGNRDILAEMKPWECFLGEVDPSIFTVETYIDEELSGIHATSSLYMYETCINNYPWWLSYDDILGGFPVKPLMKWIGELRLDKLAYLLNDAQVGFHGKDNLLFKAFKQRPTGGEVDKYLSRIRDTLNKLIEEPEEV